MKYLANDLIVKKCVTIDVKTERFKMSVFFWNCVEYIKQSENV